MVRLGVEYRGTADGFSKGTVHRQMWTSTIMGPTCSRLASSIEQWSMMELGFCERLLLPFAAQLFPELNLAIQTCTDEAFTLLPSRIFFRSHIFTPHRSTLACLGLRTFLHDFACTLHQQQMWSLFWTANLFGKTLYQCLAQVSLQ